jgi:hypothetical protein
LQLQQSYGNGYVQRLVKMVRAQAKLAVSQPGDVQEQQADRIAEVVSRAIEHTQRQPEDEKEVQTAKVSLQRQASSEEEEEEVQREAGPEEEEEIQTARVNIQLEAVPEEEEVQLQSAPEEEEEVQTAKTSVQLEAAPEEEEEVQTSPSIQKDDKSVISEVKPELEDAINTASGGGQPLKESNREVMETAFRADFSKVKVHTDSNSDTMNRALQARAFTRGQDIFFRQGEYEPDTPTGNKLIAHELTHTIQQGASQRISRWFATGHELLTRLAALQLQKRVPIDDKVIDFLAVRSGDLDATPRSVKNLTTGVRKSKKERGKYQKEELKKQIEIWNTNSTHARDEAELPLHGEAGYYKKDFQGGMADKNKAGVNGEIKKAVDNQKASKRKESLMELSYALHSAEDRGAHGEGQEFKGHDPRIVKDAFQQMPTPNGFVLNPYFNPKWNPDDPTANPAGWKLGITYAVEALESYRSSLKTGENKDTEPLMDLGLTGKETKWRENPRMAAIMSLGGPEKKVNKLMTKMQTLMREKSALFDQMKTQDKRVKEIDAELNTIKNDKSKAAGKELQKRQKKLIKEKTGLKKKMKTNAAQINKKTRAINQIKAKLEGLEKTKTEKLTTKELKFPTERKYE